MAPVCRQLYRETALLPYSLNVWSFENYYVMKRYILKEKRLPLLQRRAIRTLLVGSELSCRGLSKTMVKYLGGLEVLLMEKNGRLEVKRLKG